MNIVKTGIPSLASKKFITAGIAALLLLLYANLEAQNSADAVADGPAPDSLNNAAVARLTRYEVKAEYQTLLRKAISDYVLYSMNQESNILSEAYHEQENPSICWIIERWSNEAAIEKSRRSATFMKVASLYQKALTQDPKIIHVKDLEPLSKKQWRSAASGNNKPIVIMLFVDSKAGTENQFKEVYHTAMPQFRSEPGVINYQLSQLKDDSTQFVTYEKFRNEDAFQYHLKFPPIQPVIDYLETSIRKQPFQAGLHRLIEFAPLLRE